MARVVIGGHWSGVSDAQQQAFIDAFTDYSIGVFASRFDGYEGERFEVLGEQPARRGAVLVENQIVRSDGEPVAINYLTRPDGNGTNWRIVDTILGGRSEEHTSELQSLMRISYAVFCLKNKKTIPKTETTSSL